MFGGVGVKKAYLYVARARARVTRRMGRHFESLQQRFARGFGATTGIHNNKKVLNADAEDEETADDTKRQVEHQVLWLFALLAVD